MSTSTDRYITSVEPTTSNTSFSETSILEDKLHDNHHCGNFLPRVTELDTSPASPNFLRVLEANSPGLSSWRMTSNDDQVQMLTMKRFLFQISLSSCSILGLQIIELSLYYLAQRKRREEERV
jgi:hypothetical protein